MPSNRPAAGGPFALEQTSKRALRTLRLGDVAAAWSLLDDKRVLDVLPTVASVSAASRPSVAQLRLVSIIAECHDYYARYRDAAEVLEPVAPLLRTWLLERGNGATPETVARSADEAEWKYRRQLLYVEHQVASSEYRRQDFGRSRLRIDSCIRFAMDHMEPVPHSVLKRLLFAQGKLALRERRPAVAVELFRSAALRAEAHLAQKRERAKDGAERGRPRPNSQVAGTQRSDLDDEERVLAHWTGLSLAVGLAQAYLSLGDVDQSRVMAIGGLRLLNPSDEVHAAYGNLVLAKAERLAADSGSTYLLQEAGRRLGRCREIFERNFAGQLSHLDLRAWHETALNAAALGRFGEARSSLSKLLKRVADPSERIADRARWLILGRLGLSDVAIRAGQFTEALTHAKEARRIAQQEHRPPLEEEAELAEHEASACSALAEEPGAPTLDVVARNLDLLVRRLDDSPSRAVPALRLAQVRLKLEDSVGARAAMANFQAVEKLVTIASVRELAADVSKALSRFGTLRLPADETGQLDLDTNLRAFVTHLLASLPNKRGSEPWNDLKVPKSTFYEIKRALAHGRVTLRARAPRKKDRAAAGAPDHEKAR